MSLDPKTSTQVVISLFPRGGDSQDGVSGRKRKARFRLYLSYISKDFHL